MVKKNEETSLATFGMTQSEFGKALLENARNENKKKFIEHATGEVSRIMQSIDKVNECIKRDNESIKIYQGRLKAIENGEFEIKADGQLKYKDESLNVPR